MLLGLWLIVSPFVVRIASPFTVLNNELVGVGLVVFGLMAQLHKPRWRSRSRAA